MTPDDETEELILDFFADVISTDPGRDPSETAGLAGWLEFFLFHNAALETDPNLLIRLLFRYGRWSQRRHRRTT